MTVAEILAQAKTLNPKERKELAKLIIDTLDIDYVSTEPKTGEEIVAMLNDMEPIEFLDSHIEDPVEWIKAQRQKRADHLKSYRDDEQ